ncbi:MAG: penicillin-binding transpeptidase domain-containing protein [Pseudomonadota bacterium]
MIDYKHVRLAAGRRWLVTWIFLVLAACLIWRAVDLQLKEGEFLQNHADARHLRVVETAVSRGMILDRNGNHLAISTPVQSVWVEPVEFLGQKSRWQALAAVLETTVEHFDALVAPRREKRFVYLRRHIAPHEAQQIAALKIPGVHLAEEQKRYYPSSEVTSHLLGFTNVDDVGQEGIELAFNELLSGKAGLRRVMRDRLGRVIADVERIQPREPAEDLHLSIDKRLQYAAYRELKTAVSAHQARAGSMVVADIRSGEILALVNQPSFNPNNRDDFAGERYRNRAVTDLFEPGSTIKPFTVAAALEAGSYDESTKVQTAPGHFKVGKHVIRDIRNFGEISIAGVLERSSNVGASRIALSLEAETLWHVFRAAGFGSLTDSGLPGEVFGVFHDHRNWREIEHATLAFGYGLSVNALQLTRAYMTLADDGFIKPLSIVRTSKPAWREPALSTATAKTVRRMLKKVVANGTGKAAQVDGFAVAGKTGTVHKISTQGYVEDQYLSLFAGMLPVEQPRFVAVVVIDEPHSGEYFGGRVAAPVFANVMTEAVRIFNLTPSEPSATEFPELTALASFDEVWR